MKIKVFTTAVGASLGYHLYDTFYNTKIEVFCKNSEENQSLLASCPSLTGNYVPSIWNCSVLLGLLYANLVEHQMIPLQRRELVTLSDGGSVGLDWMYGDRKHVVIITHGLTGGGDCNYIKDCLQNLYYAGYTVVCFNQRGVAGTKLTTPRYHNHGDPSDLMEIIDIVKRRYPTANLYGLGISIGANLILNYAGQTGKHCAFKAIVSLANPFDLQECNVKINHWTNTVYKYQITENFKWLLEKNKDVMYSCIDTHGIDIDKAFAATTPQEFDEHFTKHLFKYESVQKMYQQISCKQWLKEIKIPVLCINSKNDPISQFDHIPVDVFEASDNLVLAFTQKGGHVEWFSESYFLKVKRWIMKPTIEYFNFHKSKQRT